MSTRKEPPILQGRVPPHDLQAEAACLSAAMLDGQALATCLAVLQADMFYSDAHRLVFDACGELFKNGVAVDVVSVASWLRSRELIQRAGGAKYLGELTDATPSVANVGFHANIVRETYQRRCLIAECQAIAADGYSFKPDPRARDGERDTTLGHREWLDDAERRIFAVTSMVTRSEPEQVAKVTTPLQQHIWAVAHGQEPPVDALRPRVKLGIREYDAEFPGFADGDFVIIGGVPGMGKTSLFTSFAVNVCEETGGGVLMFSIEMPKEDQGARVLSQQALVSLRKVLVGGKERPFTAPELDRMAAASSRLSGIDFEIDHTPGISLVELTAKARRSAAKLRARGKRLRAVGVDYLQLVSVAGLRRHGSREEEVATISRSMKRLAGDLGCPVVAMSALKKYDRPNKRPVMDDLRESGALSFDADQIIFVHRDYYYSRKNHEKFNGELIQAKFRNGPTGSVDVGFWPGCVRWCDRCLPEPANQEAE